MIPIEELRIGNKVLFAEEGLECEIIEIDRDGLIVNIPENKEEVTWIELDSFEPIPITEKHLIETGFNKVSLGFNIRLSHDIFISLVICNDKVKGEYYIYIVEKNMDKPYDLVCLPKRLFHLHQLQNLITDLK